MTRTRQRARRRKFAPKEAPSSADPKPKPKFKPIPKPKPKPTPTPPPPESESDSDPEEEEEEEEPSEEEEEVEHQHAEPTESSSSKDSDESESDSDSDDDSKRETIKKLLEPFGKDQLISILKEASSSNPSLVSGILKSVESDPIHRKIFVHGLGWDTTSQTLLSAFLHFGPVEDCNVVTDKATGRSKGYGFLLFRTRAAARKALRQPQKRIGHRIASCQLASAGPPESGGGGGGGGPVGGGRKLYVANVGPQISPERLRAFFAVFGEIEDGPLGLDKAGKFRGFAMFVYKGLEGIKKALEEPLKVFEGFKLLCSVATEGRAIGKKSKAPAMAVTGTGTGAQTLAPSNVAIPAGMQVGLVAQNMNPGAVLMSQNPALGVLNPVLGMGYAPSFAGGVSQSLNRVGTAPTMGINGGFGAQPSFSGVTPSLVSGYGSQAALQGYGAYQSAQLAQPSVSAAPVAKSNPGVGSVGAPASYFGR